LELVCGLLLADKVLQVGCMMIRQVTKINWSYIGDAIPSFITLAFIPFSYSCAYGLLA
jgi:AGZA family xanthine/uracil permease-like MFS transporter